MPELMHLGASTTLFHGAKVVLIAPAVNRLPNLGLTHS